MSIKGSFSNDKAFDKDNIRSMCEATVEESAKELRKAVRAETPVLTGDLRESMEIGPVTKPYVNRYQIKVFSDVEYARWIEYGTPPHTIVPRPGTEVLAWDGHFAHRVNHPGYEGAHMFQRGASAFKQNGAERIAEKNARKYLR